MAQKNVTLSLDENIYDNYKEFCKKNAIALSRSVENFMKEQMENDKWRGIILQLSIYFVE